MHASLDTHVFECILVNMSPCKVNYHHQKTKMFRTVVMFLFSMLLKLNFNYMYMRDLGLDGR